MALQYAVPLSEGLPFGPVAFVRGSAVGYIFPFWVLPGLYFLRNGPCILSFCCSVLRAAGCQPAVATAEIACVCLMAAHATYYLRAGEAYLCLFQVRCGICGMHNQRLRELKYLRGRYGKLMACLVPYLRNKNLSVRNGANHPRAPNTAW